MSSLTIRTLGAWRHDVLDNITQNHATSFSVAAVLLVAWLGWRVYAFHLRPRWHPEEPAEMPYLIPFLGHAVPFFLDSYGFLARVREAVARDRAPFACTLFGSTMYVITKAKDVAEVDKNLETLSFDEFVQTFIRATGVSEEAIKACYIDKLPDVVAGQPNPQNGNIGDLTRLMHMAQLQSGQNGEKQEAVEARFLRSFDSQLRLENIPGTHAQVDGSTKSVETSLYDWCANFFTRAGEFAYFGTTLKRIDPEFADVFQVFDELSWQITYQVPAYFARKQVAARLHLKDSLKRYFQTPQGERGEQAWFTNAAESVLREIGIDDDDIAKLFLTIYLTINTNTRRATFWILTHLLHNPSLLDAVRRETAPAFTGEGADLTNPTHLYDHDRCPVLEAVWLETLRVASTGSSVRCVNQDTRIGGRLLRAGNRIIIPFRLLHMDETVYSGDAPKFMPERYLTTPIDGSTKTKKANGNGNGAATTTVRARGANWRPFGGGKTMCTGRFVAEHTIKACVAMILHRFDISVLGGAPIPRGDESTPGLGIMGLRKGENFQVRITARGKGGKA